MSQGQERFRPQRREIEIIRVLFDRHLSDRAVALAEARWPGSGAMVQLAYDWPELSSQEQQTRLRGLGEENLSRMRELAQLHPELDAAVAELERRGVIEDLSATLQAEAESRSEPEPPPTAETDASRSTEPEDSPPPPLETAAEEVRVQVEDEQSPFVPEVGAAETTNVDQSGNVAELDVDMPDLDLGLPSTSEVLSTEAERRDAAIRNAAAAMERVHDRLNRSAEAIMSRSSGAGAWQDPTSSSSASDWYDQRDAERLSSQNRESPALEDPERSSRMIEAPKQLATRLEDQFVVSLDNGESLPSEDELVALANELGIGLKEFDAGPGSLRALYGGLRRRGSSIEVEAGPLPSALAEKNLAVIRGRIHPKLVERMQQGWVDIPGTRATVKFHDHARVLIIPTA